MNNHGLMHLWGDLERFEDSLSRGGRGGLMNSPREFDSFGRSFLSRQGSIGAPHETSRVQRVRDALRRSGDLAKNMIVVLSAVRSADLPAKTAEFLNFWPLSVRQSATS